MATLKVVGDGLAANLFRLAPNTKLIQLVDNRFSSNASLNSTAIVAMRNVPRNLSYFGDLLVDAFEEMENFLKKNSEFEVNETTHYQISSDDDEDFHRRFQGVNLSKTHPLFNLFSNEQSFRENGYLFEPKSFLNQLKKENNSTRVESFLDEPLKLRDGEFCVYCLGANMANFFSLSDKSFISGKKVMGSYLETDYTGFNESVCMTYYTINLVYRKSDSKLIIGAANSVDYLTGDALTDLKNKYEKVLKLFQRSNLELPPFESFTLHSGIRHKSRKRMPSWGPLNIERSFQISGLYKNGYSFAFLAAKRLSEVINDEIKRS